MNTTDKVKIALGLFFALVWLAIICAHVTGAEDFVTAIKLFLVGIGAYHLNDRTNAPTSTPAPKLASEVDQDPK